VTHSATFYDIRWVALEIHDLQRLNHRDPSREKTGDYYYLRRVHPKSRWGLGGIDLVIRKDEATAFSEKISDVVLLRHSDPREDFSPIHTFSHVRTSENEYVVEGVAYFSVPDPSARSISLSAPKAQFVPAPAIVDPVPTTTVFGSEPAFEPPVPTPPVQVSSRASASFSIPASRSGCLNLGGCIGTIFKLIRWGFIVWLLLALLGYFNKWLSGNIRQDARRNDNVKSSDLRLDPAQDTMAPQPWNYLMDHQVLWKDFTDHRYDARYTTATYEYQAASKRHNAWAAIQMTDELLFYHDLYQDLYEGDRARLDSLVRYFEMERRSKLLTPLQTAEMVVTFVQEIPYVLVHEGSCRDASAAVDFIARYHSQGKPCLANVVAGVLSPYEFAHTMDGDCDTRSLLAFTLLDRMGIGASVWISREYGHSVLGVAVPVNSQHYKKVAGTRHFGTELTSKGFRIGMVSPEHTDMGNWNVVLYNR
jgi:hypothetical protein